MAVIVCPNCGNIVPVSKTKCPRCHVSLSQGGDAEVSSHEKPLVVEPKVAEPVAVEPKVAEPVAPVVEPKVAEPVAPVVEPEIASSVNASTPNPYGNWWRCVVAILMFWPLGIVSIVLKILSDKAWKSGDEKKAKTMGRYSSIFAIVGIILFVLALLA